MLTLVGPLVPTLYSLTTFPTSHRLTPDSDIDMDTVALVFIE